MAVDLIEVDIVLRWEIRNIGVSRLVINQITFLEFKTIKSLTTLLKTRPTEILHNPSLLVLLQKSSVLGSATRKQNNRERTIIKKHPLIEIYQLVLSWRLKMLNADCYDRLEVEVSRYNDIATIMKKLRENGMLNAIYELMLSVFANEHDFTVKMLNQMIASKPNS